MSEQGWSIARLDEIERIGGWAPVRAHFGIEAFGVNAWYGDEGAAVIPDHEETPRGTRSCTWSSPGMRRSP